MRSADRNVNDSAAKVASTINAFRVPVNRAGGAQPNLQSGRTHRQTRTHRSTHARKYTQVHTHARTHVPLYFRVRVTAPRIYIPIVGERQVVVVASCYLQHVAVSQHSHRGRGKHQTLCAAGHAQSGGRGLSRAMTVNKASQTGFGTCVTKVRQVVPRRGVASAPQPHFPRPCQGECVGGAYLAASIANHRRP